MTKLSVNINKVATLRNARGGNMPNVASVALDAIRFGAEGITVHPRPDERHIRYKDVYELAPLLHHTEFNIEGYPSPQFIDMVLLAKPDQVTLVPDAPDAITSNNGWNVKEHFELLSELSTLFTGAGIRMSIFVNPIVEDVTLAAKTGTDRIELYTESYATGYAENREAAIAPFVAAAAEAKHQGIGINAGHDLSLENLAYLRQCIPYIDEVSIGHALICDALYLGLEESIKRYKACLL